MPGSWLPGQRGQRWRGQPGQLAAVPRPQLTPAVALSAVLCPWMDATHPPTCHLLLCYHLVSALDFAERPVSMAGEPTGLQHGLYGLSTWSGRKQL